MRLCTEVMMRNKLYHHRMLPELMRKTWNLYQRTYFPQHKVELLILQFNITECTVSHLVNSLLLSIVFITCSLVLKGFLSKCSSSLKFRVKCCNGCLPSSKSPLRIDRSVSETKWTHITHAWHLVVDSRIIHISVQLHPSLEHLVLPSMKKKCSLGTLTVIPQTPSLQI